MIEPCEDFVLEAIEVILYLYDPFSEVGSAHSKGNRKLYEDVGLDLRLGVGNDEVYGLCLHIHDNS